MEPIAATLTFALAEAALITALAGEFLVALVVLWRLLW
jgi:hypothetical protein